MKALPNFDGDDLDWVLGELFHMTKIACRKGVLPHEYDPALFTACMRVVNAQPLEVRRFAGSAMVNLANFWLRRTPRAHTHAG